MRTISATERRACSSTGPEGAPWIGALVANTAAGAGRAADEANAGAACEAPAGAVAAPASGASVWIIPGVT